LDAPADNQTGSARPWHLAAELAGLLSILALYLWLIHWKQFGEAVLFLPQPDVTEYAYVASALRDGVSPLMPVGGELHPSRYAVIHPLLMALWSWLAGGDDAMQLYPAVAMSLAVGIFWGALVAIRLGAGWRLLCIAAILPSPLMVEIGRSLMSESTIALLSAISFLSLVLGTRVVTGKSRYAWLLLAGFSIGAVVCCRTTFAPLALLLTGVALLGAQQNARRAGIVMALGGALAAAAAAWYNWRVAGIAELSTYSHWLGGAPLFGWFQPWVGAPPPFEEFQTWQVMVGLHLGGWPWLMGHQPVWASVVMWGFAVYGAARFALTQRRGWARPCPDIDFRALVAATAAIYALLHVVTFIFYSYPLARFSVVAWPAMILGACVACERLASRLHPAGRGRLVLLVVAVYTIAHPLSLAVWVGGNVNVSLHRGRNAQRTYMLSEPLLHRTAALAMKGDNHPIFVDGLGMVRARLLMGGLGSDRVFASMVNHNHLEDGHLPQFNWYQVGAARGYLRPEDPLWQVRATETILINEFPRSAHVPFLEKLTQRGEPFYLYYPLSRSESYEVLWAWLREHGKTRETLRETAQWRLERVK
jgi:hypothetical protein